MAESTIECDHVQAGGSEEGRDVEGVGEGGRSLRMARKGTHAQAWHVHHLQVQLILVAKIVGCMGLEWIGLGSLD